MKNFRTYFTVMLCLTLLLAVPLGAQETTGAINGLVSVDDGSVLPGVTISAKNVNTGAERIIMSNSRGEYGINALPPGLYVVTAQLDGFQSKKTETRVSLGSSTAVNFELEIGAIDEVITVTNDRPLIDTTSTITGITVNASELNDKIPVAREVTQVALLAPATMDGDTAFDGGGAGAGGRTPGQNLASMGGASVAENSYQVNGLNITNFRNGLGSNLVPFEFIEEVQVKTGGYEAEFGRATGGVINMVTKSGGNSITGGASAYFEPNSLKENEPNGGSAANILSYNELEESDILEANLFLGGAIVKDRLFYYALASYRDRSLTTGCGASNCLTSDSADPFYGGKFDLNLTASHRLEATFFSDESEQDTSFQDVVLNGSSAPSLSAPYGDGTRKRGGSNFVGKYTGIFGGSTVVSAQYGGNQFDRTSFANDDIDCSIIQDARGQVITRLGCWANGTITTADDEREAYRADLDLLLANHSARFGADFEINSSNQNQVYSGDGDFYRYYLSDPSRHPQVAENTEIVRVRHYENTGSFETLTDALYLQDSWEISSNISANLGIRWERYNNKNVNGQSFIKVDDQYAPRLGFIWDPKGEGRSKVYASFGRYHLPIASNTNIRLAGGELFTENWYALEGGLNPDDTPAGLGELLETNIFSTGAVIDPRAVRAENIEPEYQDEIIIGFEQMVGENWSVGLRGVNREFGKVIEDFTLDEALGQPGAFCYVLGNPGSSYEGFEDCDQDGVLNAVSFSTEELGYPKPERHYYSVEVTANRRFTNQWMMQTSYTWSHSYGNYEGYVRSDNGQTDAGLTTLYDFAGLLDNGYGNLPNDRRHNFKLFSAYQFESGLQVGGNFSFRSGRPLNAFGIHPTDGFSALYGASSFFNQGTAVNRGSAGNTSSIWNLDLTTKYEFELGTANLSARIDVFNVFNNDETVQVVEAADRANGEVNANYLASTNFQSPRRVRLGLTLRF